MRQQHRRGEQPDAEAAVLQALPFLSPDHFSRLIDAQRAALKQGDAMARLWQDSVQDALSSGTALSSDLARSRTPQEAVSAYAEWLQGRYGRLSSGSQEAWQLWLSMTQTASLNDFGDGKSSGKHGGERKGRAARRDDDKDE